MSSIGQRILALIRKCDTLKNDSIRESLQVIYFKWHEVVMTHSSDYSLHVGMRREWKANSYTFVEVGKQRKISRWGYSVCYTDFEGGRELSELVFCGGEIFISKWRHLCYAVESSPPACPQNPTVSSACGWLMEWRTYFRVIGLRIIFLD